MNKELSIIIPTRGVNNINYVIKNYNEIFNDYKLEFIIIHQEDEDLFKRGQCFNVGVKYTTYNNLLLTDNDIIHFHNIDFGLIYENYKIPFSCWKHIQQVKIIDNKIINGKFEKDRPGNGGCNFITKNDYLKINGMSNLYCGWGAEDDEYKKRVVKVFGQWLKIPSIIGHITHERRDTRNEHTALNYNFLNGNFNYKLDGYLQTTFVEDKIITTNNIKNIFVKNINVVNDFIYKNDLNKHYKLINK